ncbi:hypothetical protein AB1Y20_005091 [Prymnesium parvum]|uniref:Calmodulin n=1 Tax=Prymnesium parvum TaxID=97485 RepID=A0AB34J577_PRYPA
MLLAQNLPSLYVLPNPDSRFDCASFRRGGHSLARACQWGLPSKPHDEAADVPTLSREQNESMEQMVAAMEVSMSRFSTDAKNSAHELFKTYRKSIIQTQPSGPLVAEEEAPQPPPERLSINRKMKKEKLRSLLQAVDDEIFRFLFRLFDPDGTGEVDSEHFVMAIALIKSMHDAPLDHQIATAFYMFDIENTGQLSKRDFISMIEATVAINLGRLLVTEEGKQFIEQQLALEYSQETLLFWQEARKFRESEMDDAARRAEARRLMDKYVVEGSELQVNLPHSMVKKITAQLDLVVNSAQPVPRDLFTAAENEVFQLMDRNAYHRFRSDPSAVESVCEDFFRHADKDQRGVISFSEYKAWVMQHPEVLVFFEQLSSSIGSLVDRTKNPAEMQWPAVMPRSTQMEKEGITQTITEQPVNEEKTDQISL